MKKVSSTSERLKYYMDHTGLTQTDILDRCAPYETEQVKISRPYLLKMHKSAGFSLCII